MNIYNRFAEHYDELMQDVNYEKWYEFIKEISGRKFENVLELACGTGGITEYMEKDPDVKTIVASDISEDMLIEANEKLGASKKVTIVNQDMRELDMGSRKFDLVLAACDGMNYILEDEDIDEVFRRVSEVLEPDGQFIFDMNSFRKLSETIGNNTFVSDSGNIFCVWENFFDEEADICEFYLTFFEKTEDGRYERFDEEHMERAYREEDLKEYLSRYFNSIDIFYDFTKEGNRGIDEITGDIAGSRVFFVCQN